MKTLFTTITLCITMLSFAQNVDLLGSLNPYPGTAYADIWGYAQNGREYAIMGVTGGTSFIDVTDPANPVEVGFIAGPTAAPYEWRDIKTHLNYAYIVTEGGGTGSGMQIVDLSNLPTSVTLVGTYNATFSTAHNLYIDDGYAYIVGASPGSGMHILDLTNPTNPAEVSYYSASNYIHDVYVYNDTAYASAGNFTSSSNVYAVVDLSNKANPQLVSSSSPIPGSYAHSGWLSEDKRYFFATDEFNARDLMVFDLIDRSTWNLVVPEWQMNSNAFIHNVFVLGNRLHISYYTEGYVILDITDPTNLQFLGQYDTYPQNDNAVYDGAWGVYPYLPSGNIIVSDMSTGLYVLQFNDPVPVELTSFTAKTINKNILLNWSTATETNNLGFEIQRKSVNNYQTIAFVEGSGTSTVVKNYAYEDNNLEQGKYYYRLKQLDYDGTYNYSNEISVDVTTPSEFTLMQNYPNPFNPSTKIDFNISESGLVTLKIFNLLGEEVRTLFQQNMEPGTHSINFIAGDLPSGTYIARLEAGKNISTIKMSLLK